MTELQDIMKLYRDEFLRNHRVSYQQLKVMNAVENCRTSALGVHIDRCGECGYERISYNSCRNRHCPKCQTFAKEEWLEKQRQNLLDIQYFHVVFTVPDDLNVVFMQNQAKMYSLLFRAVSETVLELCADKKYLGAKPGITAILHTWGQNLCFHPHLHCVVSGGGLTESNQWLNSKKKFFMPVRVLSKKFRGKFLHYLKRENLTFFNAAEYLSDTRNFSDFISSLYKKEWVTYCKPPFGNAQNVIEYLGRYTHRAAVSNSRIVKLENGNVSFNWRDYTDNNRVKLMTLTADEFIRRFLLHVLPHAFRKIRHFGIFAAKDKSNRISLCKILTRTLFVMPASLSAVDKLTKIFGEDFNLCPVCKSGRLSRASPISLSV
jgi:predicted Zn-ribbon and HTH transcriptional regulator